MTKEIFLDKLEDNGLGHHKEVLMALTRPCIRLGLTSEMEENIPIGQSKVGGLPDIPSTFQWPTEEGDIPLSFIAQINLAELSYLELDTADLLPGKGMLYFFYTQEQDAWGYDIKDRPKFKVLFHEGIDETLSRPSFPVGMKKHGIYAPSKASPIQEISFPPFYFGDLPALSQTEQDLLSAIVSEEGFINKLLGFPEIIQNPMELECELVTNGLYCGDGSGYRDPRRKLLEPDAVHWRLLLQVDSNEECDMCWGDAGRLYFWIKREDLINKDFERVWMILQCY